MTAARDLAPVTALSQRLAAADPATLTNFAWFAARRGGMRLALEAARRAAGGPDAPAAARRAVERLSAGRTDGLLLCVTPPPAGATPSPAPSEADVAADTLLDQGRSLLAAGSLDQALVRFDQLLARDPAAMSALFHRGVVLAKLRRYREALHAWEAVGHADPHGPLGAMSRRHARSARELASLFRGR